MSVTAVCPYDLHGQLQTTQEPDIRMNYSQGVFKLDHISWAGREHTFRSIAVKFLGVGSIKNEPGRFHIQESLINELCGII